MILDLNRYRRVIKPLVKLHLARNEDKNICNELTIIAEATKCHILAVGHYVLELIGPNEELEAKVGRLQNYYHDVIVTNKEKQDDSTPGEI